MKIKRPVQVPKQQKKYLSNEKYQDYAEKQFEVIYDYLDGKVLYDNPKGTNENIDFSVIKESGEIEIIYCLYYGLQSFNSTGRLPYYKGMGITLHISKIADNSAIFNVTKDIQVNDNGIEVIGEQTQTIWNGNFLNPLIEKTNTIFITRVIFY